MGLASPKAPANAIAIVSNAFDKGSNEVAGWFASQTFGIETEAGFVGMTWSPDPQKTRTLTPKLTFYVATGDYGSNELASWDDVSNGSAAVSVPNNFVLNACTVTYTATGGWTITAGAPASVSMTEDLSWFRSPAHEELVALAYLDNSTVGTDTLQAVNWDRAAEDLGGGNTYLSGTVTVTTALAAAFTYFVISGVRFTIDKPAGGATSFRFSYSGSKSADAVKSLFVAGATMLMGGSK